MILRAHHMLCILGFRGRGYTRAFVENMSRIVDGLSSSPETAVEIVDHPDDICPPCPFIKETGCSEKGPQSEERVRKRDRDVLERLGLSPGASLPWSEVLNRIGDSISRDDIRELCHDCEWLSLGFCIEGLDNLREAQGD